MFKNFLRALFFIGCLTIYGCDAVTVIGGRTIGISSGYFINEDKSLQTTFHYPLDKVWTAAEKTMEEMKAAPLEISRKIASGRIIGYIEEEKVVLSLKYLAADQTSVTVRVGITGDLISSRLISGKIADRLKAAGTE